MYRSAALTTVAPHVSAPPIASVGRGLQVLRAFRSELAPLSNAELVRRTALPKATVSRLTSTLLHLGYLRLAPDGRSFQLAAGAFAIGHAYASGSELLQLANPFLQSLGDRLETSATLAVPDGSDMLYIAYRASPRITIRFGAGSVLPMGLTAIGRAYLWGLPEGECQRMLEVLKGSAAPGQWPVMDAGIRASLAELDATGTCAVLGAFNRNTYAVALPIRVGHERVLMAMSCGRASIRPDLARERQRITPVLKEAASQLEQILKDVEGWP